MPRQTRTRRKLEYIRTTLHNVIKDSKAIGDHLIDIPMVETSLEFVELMLDNLDKHPHGHLCDVVGSLMIKQFEGEDQQDQYRATINTIFKSFENA